MKQRLFIFLFTVCLLLMGSSKAFCQKWVSLDGNLQGEAITKEIIQDDASSYKLKVTIHGFLDEIQESEKGDYHRISLGSDASLSNAGIPELPLFPQCIAIPEGTTMKSSIQEVKWTDVEIGRIFPAQEPLMEGEKARGFVIDERAYNRPFIPRVLKVGSEMEWRGIRCTGLSVCPFKYYPTENRLSVLSEFVLQVDFVKGNKAVEEKDVYEGGDPFHLFDNNIFPKKQPRRIGQVYQGDYSNAPNNKLLIIVGSGLNTIPASTKMEEFCKWKVLKGYPVQVVTTATTGTTATSIKSYIQQKYNYDNVRYVLFVGDDNEIPLKEVTSTYIPTGGSSHTIYSDYWYGCMGGDSDYLADVSIGRFSVSSLTDFENMVNKSIRYERSYQSLNDALLMAHQEGGNMSNGYQGCCEAIRTASSSLMTFYTAYGADVIYGGGNATNADVLSYINQGVSIVNYRGHASADYWGGVSWNDPYWNNAGEYFHSSQISNMSDDTNAVFFSIACHTGNITVNGECMLETFMRSQHGAVAFIGATIATGTDVNNNYDKSLFKKLLNDGVFRLGDMSVAAHARCITVLDVNNPSAAIDNAHSYLVGGDPTLELWTAVSQDISGVNFSISGNTVTLTASITSGFSMPVIDDSFNFRSTTHFSYNGGTFTKPNHNFYVVINSHNYYPYIIYCNFSNNAVIENTVFDYDAYYYGTPVTIGDLYNTGSGSNVQIKNGKKVSIANGSGGVIVASDFKCEKGARFEIK